jgi:hypothetical protein
MKEISCRLLVIGAGPGDYVNVGCIPSKALIRGWKGAARSRCSW